MGYLASLAFLSLFEASHHPGYLFMAWTSTLLVSVPTISALTSDLEILEVISKMKSHFILLAETEATL